MKLLIINSVCGTGSTGRIAAKIAEENEAKGWEIRFGYGREAYVPEDCRKWAVRIGNSLSVRLHGVLTRLFDWHADRICSWCSTRKFLKWAEKWKPDLLWLHNLHGYYINYELLFKWIKQHPEMEVKWNLHDCWAYTGHCSHFQLTGCERWKSGCYGCPEKGEYPATKFLSAAKSNWDRKKKAFCGVKKMTLITPSNWLADLTRQGFLGEYPIVVEKHPLDTSVFKPTPSDWRVINGLEGKTVVLGVASVWDRRKGFQDYLALRNLLGKKHVIVLVGLTAKQIAALPKGIVGIARTNSAKELAEIYSAVDWFFNPTHEDIYSMTNMEAAACGCRVVTYDTGGAPEAVDGYEKAWVLKGADKSPEGFVKLLKSQENI
jgi:glycosyltransferase involved in cell wall biosynthesis